MPPHLISNLSGLLGKCVVFFLGFPDVLLVSQSFHVLQLLVGELQLLLVMTVLLHFGLKVMELLLNEQGKGGTDKKWEHTFG